MPDDEKSLGSLVIDAFVTRNVLKRPTPRKKKRMSKVDKLSAQISAKEAAARKRVRQLYEHSVGIWRQTLRGLYKK